MNRFNRSAGAMLAKTFIAARRLRDRDALE
jgi:hypothetical protein